MKIVGEEFNGCYIEILIIVFFRQRERVVLEKGVIRRTRCVGDAVGHLTTSRSHSAPSVDIPGRSCVIVS